MSILFILALIPLTLYAYYIHLMRSGRNNKGQFSKRNKQVEEQLFYSEIHKYVTHK